MHTALITSNKKMTKKKKKCCSGSINLKSMEYSKSFPLVENIIKETLIYEGRVLHKWNLPQFQVGDFQACTFSHPNNSRNHVNNIIISYLELSNGNLHNYYCHFFFNNTLNQQLTE